MILFHADVKIQFGFEVRDVIPWTLYELESDERKIRAKCVVVCNGMGDPKTNAFASDRRSEKIMLGDDFLSQCSAGSPLAKSIGQMNLAVIGAGDTANCVMERILPLVYPSSEYGPSNACSSMPLSVVWIGQTARDIREFFFANKTRYAHAGGLIELFWDGDHPFELPLNTWRRARGSSVNLLRSCP